jgi:hypothetical protein
LLTTHPLPLPADATAFGDWVVDADGELSRMFTATQRRVHESVAVKIVGQQRAEGEVARQLRRTRSTQRPAVPLESCRVDLCCPVGAS